MSETKPIIIGNQPLDTMQGNYLLVSVTEYTLNELDEMEDVTSIFVMPDGPRSQDWLEGLKDYDRRVTWETIEMKAEPKVVHALIDFEGASLTTACRISAERRKKYHQTVDQAFHRVMEKPNCKQCKQAVLGTQWKPDWDNGNLQGLTLKQWSWDNVDEDYRPGGSKHRFSRTTP